MSSWKMEICSRWARRGAFPPRAAAPAEANRGGYRLGLPHGKPEARRGGERFRQDAEARDPRGERPHQQVPEEHQVGEERAKRRGYRAFPRDDRSLQEVLRPERQRLAAPGGPGVSGGPGWPGGAE